MVLAQLDAVGSFTRGDGRRRVAISTEGAGEFVDTIGAHEVCWQHVARFELSRPACCEVSDRGVSANLTDETKGGHRKIVVGLLERRAPDLGDGVDARRPAAPADTAGTEGRGVTRRNDPVGLEVVEVPAHDGPAQTESDSELGGGRRPVAQQRSSDPLCTAYDFHTPIVAQFRRTVQRGVALDSPTVSEPAVRIRDLTMSYGPVRAVDGLDLDIPAGGVTAVLGRNGAGKTTTLETCAGVRRAQSGSVEVLGRDPWRNPYLCERVGVMLQSGGVPGMARGLEYVRHLAGMYADPQDVEALADRLGIAGLRNPFRRMSGGEQQRVRMACALVGRPELVFLDEPTSGLDPLARAMVWEVIGDLTAAGVTVVVSTHQFDEAERLADNVVIIASGKVRAHGSPRQLSGGAASRLSFLSGIRLETNDLASRLPGCTIAEPSPGRYVVEGDLPDDAESRVRRWADERDVVVRDVNRGARTLEDVFHEVSA